MARIPEVELERLKRSVDLVALVRRSGVELRRQGKDWAGLCPFHDDREPSLVVTPSKGLWRCLGACSAGGSVIDWVMRSETVGFREAVERLQGLGVVRFPLSVDRAEVSAGQRVRLLGEVWAAYREAFRESEAAQRYVEARGIGGAEAVERFGYGYADRSLSRRLLQGRDAKKKRETLKALGVLRRSGHEHLAGCLVVPVCDVLGQVETFYGRRIRGGQPKHLVLPGPHRGVFNIASLKHQEEVILCESILDAITFWCAGFPAVTAAWGTSGLTDRHVEAIVGHARARRGPPRLRRRRGGPQRRGRSRDPAPPPRSRGRPESSSPKAKTPTLSLLQQDDPQPAFTHLLATAPFHFDHQPPTTNQQPRNLLRTTGQRKTENDLSRKSIERYGNRSYRIRALDKNLSYERLKVVIRARRDGGGFFVDSVDLVAAKQRTSFIRQAAAELEVKESVIKKDLGRLHLELEELQDELIRRTLASDEPTPVTMSREAEAEALAFLRRPDLLDEVLADFDRCGLVGEPTNKLLGYLAAVSRKLEKPLAVLVQSSSAAGKSALMEAVLEFVPEEERVQYSAMTGQSLYYLGEEDLKHKVLGSGRGRRRRPGVLCAQAPPKRGDTLDRLDGQGPRLGAFGDAGVPGGRAGDALLDHHLDRDRRGAPQPLPRAFGRREPGADAGDPPSAAPRGDPRGPAGSSPAASRGREAPERPASLGTADDRQSLLRAAHLPRREDPNAPRPQEVPDPHPRSDAPPPAPAPPRPSSRRGRRSRVRRGDAGRHRDRQPPSPPRSWAGRSPRSRRRRVASSSSSIAGSRAAATPSRWTNGTFASAAARLAKRPAGATSR